MWILSLASLTAWSLASLGCALLSLFFPFAYATRVTNLADIECGSGPSRESRIVGGYNVDIKAFPHAVSIKKNGDLWCGGSLVRQMQGSVQISD